MILKPMMYVLLLIIVYILHILPISQQKKTTNSGNDVMYLYIK